MGHIFTFRGFINSSVILSVYLCLFPISPLLAISPTFPKFIAKKAKGSVYILKPWNYYWEKIPIGKPLPTDSIIQLSSNSTLTLNYRYLKNNQPKKKTF